MLRPGSPPSVLPLAASPPPAPGDYLCTRQAGGRERVFLLHLPPAIATGAALPLVIMLHGRGSSSRHFSRLTGMSATADQAGFVAVYPQGSDRPGGRQLTWNAGFCCGYARDTGVDDVGFLRGLIERLHAAYGTDPRRTYAAGHSNGGVLCYRLAGEASDLLAAIAPVAGAMAGTDALPPRPMAVLAVHGTLDRAVRYGGYIHHGQPLFQPVEATVARWAAHNGCAPTPQRAENWASRQDRYTGGRAGSAVVLYTIKRGGHAWLPDRVARRLVARPPGARSLADILWDFFQQHPRSG
jgi:polyhydroxybutyrate depolymerase